MKTIVIIIIGSIGFCFFPKQEAQKKPYVWQDPYSFRIYQYDTAYARNDTFYFEGNVSSKGQLMFLNAERAMIYNKGERALLVHPKEFQATKVIEFKKMKKGNEVVAVMFDKELSIVWAGEEDKETYYHRSDYDE